MVGPFRCLQKQVPLSDNAFELDSYLAVCDPFQEGQEFPNKGCYPLALLPQSRPSRVSLAIWKIGPSLLKLMRSAYFDDFL